MLFAHNKLLLIAGPCVVENLPMAQEIAHTLSRIQASHSNDLKIIYKGSFDKANRSSAQGKRGPGVELGLDILNAIKTEFHFPLLTDIHLPEHARIAAQVCDVLQIPAFLCRQTDLLLAAAETPCTINVKKGQFLAPEDMKLIVEKLQHAQEVWLTERGACFGYHRLIVDMRSFAIMRAYNCPTIFDATHSVQLPGAGKGQSGGERQFVPTLAKAALAAGAQGLFIETHPNPPMAFSDSETQWPLHQLEGLIEDCIKIWKSNQMTHC